MNSTADPALWTTVLRDFGLPTFLLLLFVGLGIWGLRKLFPLVKNLVDTHVEFVNSMNREVKLFREGQEESRRCQEEFRSYLRKRDSAQAEEAKAIREAIERLQLRG